MHNFRKNLLPSTKSVEEIGIAYVHLGNPIVRKRFTPANTTNKIHARKWEGFPARDKLLQNIIKYNNLK